MKAFFAAGLTILTMVLLLACSSNPNEAIIGSWLCRDTSQSHIFLCDLTFDGNGGFIDGDGDRGSFIISGNVLHLDFDDYGRNTFNFQLRGNRLTITSGEDVNIVLARQ